MQGYDFKTIEPEVLDFWKDSRIYEKAVQKNSKGKRFYYLDGPPYTTGMIHIGHSWGKALRDSILRYKRMQGFNVFDRPGFDMHGLPIEVNVEKQLGIKDKKEILNKIGLAAFIEECQKYTLAQLWPMVEDFKKIGIWLDWQNPYMTIKNEYIEAAWWALAKANEKKLLYLGKKVMTWCPRCATVLAKHELEYESKKEDSIFVKLKVEAKNEYLIVWTTTPWTIPYNLAVMAHPDIDYVKAKVGDEIWILAEALVEGVIGAVAGKQYTIIDRFKGRKLAGTKYEQPFKEEVKFHNELKQKNAYTVILSEKYVTIDAGSGLVHCAPGCGPEDFEVGKEHGLPAFNEIDEHGCFRESMGRLAGMIAKQDDSNFIQLLEDKGAIVAKTKYEHEYAHCWRCATPVIFRATDQWFLAVERLKEEMIEKNKKVHWVPDWAGNKWFDSWLKSLQDWCISRQRFWGVPLPIWKCSCEKYRVISSNAELKKLSGVELENMHRPWVDRVEITCSCGQKMTRVPDVLDVWLDSGVAPWAVLNFPSDEQKFAELGFPDLILEGKDQIRGWFNSLMCMSMVSFGKTPYSAIYMHGMINDSLGRKMSKSLKNTISPYEIIETYGADTLRYYQIGGAQPGLDLNFNHQDAKIKHKNLIILWNVHNYLFELAKDLKANPAEMDGAVMNALCDVEERCILSKLNNCIKKTTQLFDNYKLNETPLAIEEFFLTLSRSYIQMVRDKASLGEENDRKAVLYTIYKCFIETIRMLAPIAPFVCEKMWQNLRKEFGLKEESIHHCSWPKYNEKEINNALEEKMAIIDQTVQAVLAAREKAKLPLRWPVHSVHIVMEKAESRAVLEELEEVAKKMANCKEMHPHAQFEEIKEEIKPNAGAIGKAYGSMSPRIIAKLIEMNSKNIIEQLAKNGKFTVNADSKTFELNKDCITIERRVPEKYAESEYPLGIVYLDKQLTPELEAEGSAREIMRSVQQARKEAGLKKADKISLYLQVSAELESALNQWTVKIGEKCGARACKMGTALPARKHKHEAEIEVKKEKIKIFFDA